MQDSDNKAKKCSRCDGLASRERLLSEALRLFAEQGFAKTSTRAIAQAAGVNISAISYYFGDKEGLYRAAFYEPFAEHSDIQSEIAAILAPELSLRQALHLFFSRKLTPFTQGVHMQQCLRLHMREMVEHTVLWEEELQQRILPKHAAMRDLLTRHLGLPQSDMEIDRLVCGIIAMDKLPDLLWTTDIAGHVTALTERLGAPPDRAVLGCTHYEIVADLFRAALPPGEQLRAQLFHIHHPFHPL